MGKMRVCAYCRVSTDSELQSGSLENQIRFFKAYISQNADYVFTKIYADSGKSGTGTQNRAAFCRMLQDAENGAFNLILTKEVSRFARNIVDALETTRHLKSLGIGVFFLNDNILTTECDGELRLTLMAALAQEESRKTSARVKWGMRRCMEKGIALTPPLLGYDLEGGKLKVNPNEAKTVRLIFEKYAYEGLSPAAVADFLFDKGLLPAKRIKSRSGTTIKRILSNEKYIGNLVQGKTEVLDFLNHKSVPLTDEGRYVRVLHAHEPIIPQKLWDAAQARLKKEKQTRRKSKNTGWQFGALRCGLCKAGYISAVRKMKNGSRVRYFRCGENARRGAPRQGKKDGCRNLSVREDTLCSATLCALNSLENGEKKAVLSYLKMHMNPKIYKEKTPETADFQKTALWVLTEKITIFPNRILVRFAPLNTEISVLFSVLGRGKNRTVRCARENNGADFGLKTSNGGCAD